MISTIKTQIILASTSETRRQILERYNIKAKYVEHTVDEDKEIEEYTEMKSGLAKYLARKKYKKKNLENYQKLELKKKQR